LFLSSRKIDGLRRAVMLSAESASGRYPVEAVRMMSRIVSHTEDDPHYRTSIDASRSNPSANAADAIGFAMRHVTELLQAAATVAYTSSGYSHCAWPASARAHPSSA
jgi:pyruvate kinase